MLPLTMEDWEKRLNTFIEMFEYGLLKDAGRVTTEIAKLHAETEFEKYRIVQDKLFLSDYDPLPVGAGGGNERKTVICLISE